MSNTQSGGSKLGAVAGSVVSIAFFLPWVRACGSELSGYDLATNSTGQVEDPWIYWLSLLAGLVCIALFFSYKTDRSSSRIRAAATRLVTGLIGFFPLLNIYYNVEQRGRGIDILPGGWIIATGYLAIFVSFFVDLGGKSEANE